MMQQLDGGPCACTASLLILRSPPVPCPAPNVLPPVRPAFPLCVPRRVNSGDMTAAAEHLGTPLGSARSTAHHHSIFSGASASSPRDHGVELCAVLAVGGGGGASGGKSSGAGTPQHSQQHQQQHLLAKKHTPAPAGEMVQLLDRLQGDSAGGSSTGGPSSAGGSRVHLRSSYTGEGGGLGGSSSNVSPLGFVAAARGRLTSLTSG